MREFYLENYLTKNIMNSFINSLIFYSFFYLNIIFFILLNSPNILLTNIPNTSYNISLYLIVLFIPSIFMMTLTDMKNRQSKTNIFYEWYERSFNIDTYSILLSLFSSGIYSIIFIKTELYLSMVCMIFGYNIFRIWWFQCDPVAVIIIGGRDFFNYINSPSDFQYASLVYK